MKKILILLTCFMFLTAFSGSASAQPTVAWAVSYDSGGSDTARGVAVDSNDNVIVTGRLYLGRITDYNTIKYDSKGNLLWEVSYDSGSTDEATGVAIDSNDNVIVTGVGNAGYNTIKYDSNGNLLWEVRYDGGSDDRAFGVAVDSNDNVIVTGVSYLGGGHDYNTIKYDSNGNLLWAKSYDGGGDDWGGTGVTVDSNDNVIVTGRSWLVETYDYYTIKYDSNGNLLWAKSYDSRVQDYATGVAVDSNDNVIVTGYSFVWQNDDYNTIKYDSNGNLLWAKSYDSGGQDYATGVTVDSNDNVIVTGALVLGENVDYDYNTIKYGSNGNLLWEVSYDSGVWDWGAIGVTVDSSDNVIVTGSSYLGETRDYYTIKYISEVITATVDFHPDTLKGRWVTVYIELPEGYDVADINVSTVLLNDTISAELHPSKIGDYDNDGIPDLMVRFDKADVADLIKALNLDLPADVELTVTGSLTDGTQFSGSDTIRVRDKGGL